MSRALNFQREEATRPPPTRSRREKEWAFVSSRRASASSRNTVAGISHFTGLERGIVNDRPAHDEERVPLRVGPSKVRPAIDIARRKNGRVGRLNPSVCFPRAGTAARNPEHSTDIAKVATESISHLSGLNIKLRNSISSMSTTFSLTDILLRNRKACRLHFTQRLLFTTLFLSLLKSL